MQAGERGEGVEEEEYGDDFVDVEVDEELMSPQISARSNVMPAYNAGRAFIEP